jgi:thiol-disulfide isomerase/thioredoxin
MTALSPRRLVAAAGLVAALAMGCVRLPTPPALVEDGASRRGLVAGPGGSALDFSAKRWPEGATWRLSQERGSVVLLDVWATWCDPCRESLPFYGDVATQFGARGLKVYALSVDADVGPIGPFLKELKLSLPILHDPGAAMAEETLKVRQMPTSFLFDRRGVLRHVHEGLSDDYFQQTLGEVEALLAEPAP